MSDLFRVAEMAAAKTPRKARQMAEKVTESVLDNGVLQKALEIAEDHPQRIEIIDDKTAIVWNSREQKHDMQAQRVLGKLRKN